MELRKSVFLFASLGAAAALFVGCGGSSHSPTSPGPGATTAMMTLATSGISPNMATVRQGAQVTFVNNDSVQHEIASDPHPVHTECPELNGPVLGPGMSFTAMMANRDERCGFHDHLNPTNAAFQGVIVVSSSTGGGGGGGY